MRLPLRPHVVAGEPPLWTRKYMDTNSESITYYFKYLEYSYLFLLTHHRAGQMFHKRIVEIELGSP